MENKLLEKIKELKHVNKAASGSPGAVEELEVPEDVMIECDGLVKIYKTKKCWRSRDWI